MKYLTFVSFFVSIATVSSFKKSLVSLKSTALRSTTTTVPEIFKTAHIKNELTPRVVLDPLPKLYVYDHCPFCVRVRLAFGLKNIKYDCQFLANDDVKTPTGLVGKKVAPIFEQPGVIPAMPESLDIIEKVDSDPSFGPTGFFKPFSPRTDLKAWQKKYAGINRIMQRPRYMLTDLPEFTQMDGKRAFVFNHPIGSYEKADWRANLSTEEQWKIYGDAYTESLGLISQGNEALKELDALIHSPDHCSPEGLGYDDIDVWSRVRSMTLVKGLEFPDKLKAYMTNLSQKGDIPLYFDIAC